MLCQKMKKNIMWDYVFGFISSTFMVTKPCAGSALCGKVCRCLIILFKEVSVWSRVGLSDYQNLEYGVANELNCSRVFSDYSWCVTSLGK